jgi:HAD superfamily phosphatase (TIGR01668 family)
MNLNSYIKFWLKPNKKEIITHRYNSIFDINWKNINKDYKTIVFDVDDTISAHKADIDIPVMNLLTKLKNQGKQIILLSNCNKKRGDYLQKAFGHIGIYVIFNADKPNPKHLVNIIDHLKINYNQCVVVGERVATDLYTAFLIKIPTRILVKPYSIVFNRPKADLLYKSIRTIENWFARNT